MIRIMAARKSHEPAFPRSIFASYILMWLAAWTLVPLMLHVLPHSDNLEQLEWVQQLALGYAKHPPLPTWILWLFGEIFPLGLELTYALGALQVATMLVCAFYIARELLDPVRASLAVILCTFITYYTLRMHYYNHNTSLLVATSVAVAALVAALKRDRALNWLLLGVAWGAGMLSKYEMAIGIACNVGAILASDLSWSRRVRACALAGLAGFLVFLPHLVWLFANDFPPLHYAAKFIGAQLAAPARLDRILSFSADQLLRLLPMFVLLAVLLRIERKTSATVDASTAATLAGPPPKALTFLAVHALGPLALIVLFGVFGADLETHWGTAYLWAVPLWLLARGIPSRLAKLPPRLVLAIASALQLVMLIGYVIDESRT